MIGSEEDLVLFGGDNTSIKRHISDVRNMDVSALTVKGSGSDMQFASPENFSDLHLEDISPLLERRSMTTGAMFPVDGGLPEAFPRWRASISKNFDLY